MFRAAGWGWVPAEKHNENVSSKFIFTFFKNGGLECCLILVILNFPWLQGSDANSDSLSQKVIRSFILEKVKQSRTRKAGLKLDLRNVLSQDAEHHDESLTAVTPLRQ